MRPRHPFRTAPNHHRSDLEEDLTFLLGFITRITASAAIGTALYIPKKIIRKIPAPYYIKP